MSLDLRYATSLLARENCSVVRGSRPKFTAAILIGAAIAGVTLVSTGQAGCAGELQAGDDDARARRLIDDVVKTYRSLHAYVDRGQVSVVTRFRGKQRTKTSPVSLAFSRPNRLAFRSARTELVCDGKQLSIAWAPFRRYVVIEAPESIAYSSMTHRMDDATRTVVLPADQPHFPLVMALLSGSAQAARILPYQGAVVEPDRKLDGKTLHSLLHTAMVDVDMSASARLLIDPDTKLIRQIQEFYRYTAEDLARIDNEEPAIRWDVERSWTASSIQTGGAPADLFTYQPPPDFTRVGNFKHASLLATAGFDLPLMLVLGKPLPDFTLTVVDNTGSSRKASKSDLAGKVVVIVCWSIHNESCFEALREIRKIVQRANAGDGIALVALNVDEDPADIKELSARVRRALSDKKVALEGTRGCLIAVDPLGAISDLLPVAGLPAVVLLDTQGVVQTSHAEKGTELTGALSKEIETLLAGKSLETPELKALDSFDADESRPTALIEEPRAFKAIEALGGVVIRAGGEGRTAEIDIQLDAAENGDELLAKLVPHLKLLEQITCLRLQNTRVTDAGLAPLRGMSNIFSINLEGTAISDRGLDSLKTISRLKYAFLAGTRVTEDGTLALKRARPGLFAYYLTPPIRGKATK
jgi:thiol-disulfide isomerase/thioredoxin